MAASQGTPSIIDGLAWVTEPGLQSSGLPDLGVELGNFLHWFATNNVNGIKIGFAEELVTLSIVGTTTDTTGNLLPANALILAVCYRVTTTISGAGVTSFSIGDATTAARFVANDATLTAGTAKVGFKQFDGSIGTSAAGPTQSAAATVRVTATGGTPAAGVVRIQVAAISFAGPTA